LRFIQEECLDNSDVVSDIDEMTETPPKKERKKTAYTRVHQQRWNKKEASS
jgi:hypothetical protein